MNSQILNDIKEAALDFWIDYNYEVAQGRKEGEEWLDEEEEEIQPVILTNEEYEESKAEIRWNGYTKTEKMDRICEEYCDWFEVRHSHEEGFDTNKPFAGKTLDAFEAWMRQWGEYNVEEKMELIKLGIITDCSVFQFYGLGSNK